VHLNIYQIPVAFTAGLFLAWVFYKSRSLWPCIFAHLVINTGAFVFSSPASDSESSGAIVILGSIALSTWGMRMLYDIFTNTSEAGTKSVQ
jgi:membrane protease YdiL (CAAX protease family)